jgi:drug/metabolite transporter (DMT)-like permease
MTCLYLEPIVTVVVASTWIGERVTRAALSGGSIILLGVWRVNRPPRRARDHDLIYNMHRAKDVSVHATRY